ATPQRSGHALAGQTQYPVIADRAREVPRTLVVDHRVFAAPRLVVSLGVHKFEHRGEVRRAHLRAARERGFKLAQARARAPTLTAAQRGQGVEDEQGDDQRDEARVGTRGADQVLLRRTALPCLPGTIALAEHEGGDADGDASARALD